MRTADPRGSAIITLVEQRISLITLGVDDLDRARAFYEALGWSGAHQPDREVAFFQAGGMVFGLWTALGGHGAPGIELAHNVRSPEDVDALLAHAERVGGSIVVPPSAPIGAATRGPSPIRMVMCGRWLTTLTGRWPRTARFGSTRSGRSCSA